MIGKCVFRSQNKRQFAWALARRWLNVGTVRWSQVVVTSQVLAHKSQRFVCVAHETTIFIGNAGDYKSLLDPWVRLDNLDLHWSGSLIKINIFSCVKQCTIHTGNVFQLKPEQKRNRNKTILMMFYWICCCHFPLWIYIMQSGWACLQSVHRSSCHGQHTHKQLFIIEKHREQTFEKSQQQKEKLLEHDNFSLCRTKQEKVEDEDHMIKELTQ